jgi:WD40 repeat protein
MQESDSILTASGGNVAVLWSGLNLQHQADDAKMQHQADGKDTFILKGHTGSVTHAAFHSEKPLIATCSYDSTVMLWSKDTKQRIHTFEGHTDRVWSVAFSNPTTTANNFIVSAGADCTSRIWDIDAQVCVAVLTGFTASIWSASFIPHSTKCKDARLDEATIRTAFGGRIITTSKDADIVCWDSRAREGISIFRPTGDHAECTACAYSSQSTSELVTSSKSTSGDSSGIVRIWSLRALARETQLKQEDEALKQEKARSFESRMEVLNQELKLLKQDKARSFESRIEAGLQELKPSELLMDRWTVDHELCRPIDLDPSGNGHTGCVLSVDFSSDGNRLVTASTDLTAIVWERTSGSAAVDAPAWKMITRIRDTGEKMITRIRDTSETSERRELSEARFHPNNSNVVVIGSGGKWFEGKHKRLKGCQGEVTVWTGGDDESEWVSKIFCDGRNPAHKGITRTVAWSTNGKQIISAGGVKGKGGSSVAVWNAATEDLVHRYVYFFHETI